MFGLYTLYKYLLLLICSPFGFICSDAMLEEEGDLNSITDLFDRGVQSSPVFIKEPKDRYYVVKSVPSLIECIAQGAVHISFKCAGSWIKQHHHTNNLFIDPVTQKETLHSSIYVSREDVEDYYGSDGYWCECYASDHKSETPGANIVKSKRGFVELAYLKKRFEREPVSRRVEHEQQALLQCLPPDGKPLPKVFWLKDGQAIDVKGDINFIISSEGSLIINQARLIDTGNYTCGAHNIASRRLSPTVHLTVYVNGGWSSWSKWTACSVSCGKGWQHRERTCTNPSPRGRGDDCAGEVMERSSCTYICPDIKKGIIFPIDRELNRQGIETGTKEGTLPGDETLSRHGIVTEAHEVESTENLTMYIGLCVASTVFIIMIIIIIIIIKRRSRHQTNDNSHFTSGGSGNMSLPYDEKKFKNGHLLSMQPDVTQISSVQSPPADPSIDTHTNPYYELPAYAEVKDCVYSGPAVGNGCLENGLYTSTPLQPHLNQADSGLYSSTSLQPNINQTDNGLYSSTPLQPNLNQTDNFMNPIAPQMTKTLGSSDNFLNPSAPQMTKTLGSSDNFLNPSAPQMTKTLGSSDNFLNPIAHQMTKTPGSFGHLESNRVNKNRFANNTVIVPPFIPYTDANDSLDICENYDVRDSDNSLASCELPRHIDTDAVTWKTFDHRGGRLTLPESGVSLLIPEGAIEDGHKEEMYLAVCRDDKDRPKLSDKQTILSPVVLCGPTDLLLQKPVVLSIQHCASMRQGGWKLSVCSSCTPLEEAPQWQINVTIGQENVNTQIFTQLDATHCHIMTEHLQRYTLLGEPAFLGRAIKILRLAAFAPMSPPSMDYSIRVYVVEDTPDALEGVMQMERRLHGRLLDKPKQIPFQDGGQNLCLTIEELAPGWRSKLAASYQEIPFGHIWSGNQNNLHCSFSLEMVDRAQDAISCLIQVYQKAILSNRQVLKINTNFKQSPVCSVPVSSSVNSHPSTVTANSNSGVSSVVSHDDSSQASRLPPHIRNQLCALLDTPCARGNDWRMLAQALTFDRYINYFAIKTSPTEYILNLWEACYRQDTAISELMNILRVMGRMDAAAVLEKDSGAWL